MQRRNVDLPEPEGPRITTTSPGHDIQVDALQHLQLAEGLMDVAAAPGARHDDSHGLVRCTVAPVRAGSPAAPLRRVAPRA